MGNLYSHPPKEHSLPSSSQLTTTTTSKHNNMLSPIQQPPLLLDLDVIAKVLSHTFLSPFFAVFVPLTLMGQGFNAETSVFQWSCGYAGGVCLMSFFSHLTKIYSSHYGSSRTTTTSSSSSSSRWLSKLLLRPPPLQWQDQIVLITGGASGLGALLADTLAMKGVEVVVLDVKKRPGEGEGAGEAQNITSYICDVSDYDQVMKTAKIVQEEIGHPTILINNAGTHSSSLLLSSSPSQISKTFNVNTLSHFWALKAFLPEMIRRDEGCVVTVGSVLGVVGCGQMMDYCASKAAVMMIHDSLRYELKSRYNSPNIQTTLLLPGHIATPLFSRISLPTNYLYRFLAPTLQPHDVVKAIIQNLDDRESKVIRMPFYSNFARVVGVGAGLVPVWGRDFLQWWTGADSSMSNYGPQEPILPAAEGLDSKIDEKVASAML